MINSPDERVYPTFEEALRITGEYAVAWRPFCHKPLAALLAQALKEPTGVAYDALWISDKRAFIVLCVAGTSDTNKGLIAALAEKAGGSMADQLPGDVSVGEAAVDAFNKQSLTILPLREPYAVILAAADPRTVAFVEKDFLNE